MSAMMCAGQKDSEGKFTGIIMGTIDHNTGLYGY
jgi:hypothetical protein